MSGLLPLVAGALPTLEQVPLLKDWINRGIVDATEAATATRPMPFSCWTPGPAWAPARLPDDPPAEGYIGWNSLTDRGYTGRHLPPLASPADPAPIGTLRPDGSAAPGTLLAVLQRRSFLPCPRSSTLLCFFAQWFTDSFLRTDPTDLRRNRSNHDIDMCQIYGPNEATTRMLRAGAGGRLRTRDVRGAAFPDRLMDDAAAGGTAQPRARYTAQPGYVEAILGLFNDSVTPPPPSARVRLASAETTAFRRAALYASGLEQGSSTIFYAAISTIMIREHNRIAAELARRQPQWDDDRLFETARNIVIALGLKLVLEDYISHLSGLPQQMTLGFAEQRPWYRANRISIEFDLLYRWHALVPDRIGVGPDAVPPDGFRFNNELLEQRGAETLLAAATRQQAGRIGLRNTPAFLLPVEQRSLMLSRMHRLQPYVQYQASFGCRPYGSFQELTGDADLAGELSALYDGKLDQVDFTIGLLAEKRDPDAVLGRLMEVMVGVDAFSQVYTNPLLSAHVFGSAAFSGYGIEVLQQTSRLDDVVRRNGGDGGPTVALRYTPPD